MFQVKIDDVIALDTRYDELKLINPKVELEVNTVGAFDFQITEDNPAYSHIEKMKTIVKVYQRGKLIFRGRVLEDKEDFYKIKQVDCEGELAFLLDSIYRPFDLTGQSVSIRAFFKDLINNHNSQVKDFQKFKIGKIEVEDPNEKINFSSESALKTWDIIKSRLIDNYGGYLYITYDNDENPIINYLSDFSYTSIQKIEFGKNLLDIGTLISGVDIATAIIPYGAKLKDAQGNDTTKRITISEVNDLKDYLIDEEMAEIYGIIYMDPEKSVWDDVTEPSNLLTKAKKALAESVMLSSTIEIKAVDLAYTDEDIENFHFCDYIKLFSTYHGIDKTYLLKKLYIELLNVANTTITLGETRKTLTDSTKSTSTIIKQVTQITKDYVTNETVQYVVNETISGSSVIEQTAEEVVLSVMDDYVMQTNFDTYKETNSSELQVLAEQIVANFTNTTSSIESVDGDLQQKYEELKSYIRGYQNETGQPVVELGDAQSNIKLKLENDEIYFDVNGVKRFYLTAEGKIVFKNAVFEETTEINGFAFVPRSNGNLSFIKVVK